MIFCSKTRLTPISTKLDKGTKDKKQLLKQRAKSTGKSKNRSKTTTKNKHQRPPPQSIFKAALEDKFRALLSTHLCDASNWICSRAIVTYVGLNSNGVTFNMGNFDIQLSADGTLVYLYREKALRLVSKSDCCTIKIRIFGTKEPGACIPPKYIYVLFKQGQNLLQCSPEDHLKSVIESNEYYPEEHEYYC
jgi:hypothetical protein